jgi:endonuclease-3
LFKKYQDLKSYGQADISELEEDVKSTGFYKNKAKSIKGLANAILENHMGEVPGDIESLINLPGVGRKTANVVLNECFGKSEIVVDTHFKRVGARTGLTSNTSPDKIEKDFIEICPAEKRKHLSHLFTYHGRFICDARKPDCESCPINTLCDYYNNKQKTAL